MTGTHTTVDERALNQPDSFRHVVAASRKRLFAVFDDPQEGLGAIAAIPAADLISGEQTWLFHGEEGLRRLDPSGAAHGLYGRLVRGVQLAVSDDNRYVDALARALHDDALVVALPVTDIETADRLAAALQARSGHTFAYTKHMDFVPTLGQI